MGFTSEALTPSSHTAKGVAGGRFDVATAQRPTIAVTRRVAWLCMGISTSHSTATACSKHNNVRPSSQLRQ